MFEIHAPGVSTDAINQEVEARAKRRHSLEDVTRVAGISLSPLVGGGKGFEASATCDLFERPVPPPDFSSWQYRFVRGPLKPLASKLYAVLAQIVARISENRTQAFYNVVYELLDLRRENEELKKRLDRLEAAQGSQKPANASEPPAVEPPIQEAKPPYRSSSPNRPRPL